jgi:Kef-type K+ transport system membrane component KefB
LILGIALSITAIPILGRIMIELDIHRTPLGTLTITAAAIDDAAGWILLATVSTMIHSGFDGMLVFRMTVATCGFVAACYLLAKYFLPSAMSFILDESTGQLTLTGLSVVLVGVFSAAAITNAIGIFSIFGPFILGAVLSNQHQLHGAINSRLKEIVFAMFLPIFFTYTGLRTDVGLLDSWQHWLICGLLILAATAGKMAGCGLAAKWGGMSWRDSGCVALMMNTRALMGLIAINVGRDLGVIPESVFCMLVMMALVTTLLTTPLLRRLLAAKQTPSAA